MPQRVLFLFHRWNANNQIKPVHERWHCYSHALGEEGFLQMAPGHPCRRWWQSKPEQQRQKRTGEAWDSTGFQASGSCPRCPRLRKMSVPPTTFAIYNKPCPSGIHCSLAGPSCCPWHINTPCPPFHRLTQLPSVLKVYELIPRTSSQVSRLLSHCTCSELANRHPRGGRGTFWKTSEICLARDQRSAIKKEVAWTAISVPC